MWRAITEQDLLQHISGVELDTFRAVVLGEGQADPIAGYLTAAAKEAASYAAAAGYEIGDQGTAPEELIESCCARVVIKVQARAAGTLIDPDGIRQKAASEALSLFKDVSKGNYLLTEPLTATMQAEPAQHSGCTHRPRPPRVNAESMKGL